MMFRHYAKWAQETGLVSTSFGKMNTTETSATVTYRDGRIVEIRSHISMPTPDKLTCEDFAEIMSANGIEVPTPEEPRWWIRGFDGSWSKAWGRHFTYEEANDGDWSCRIFSTTEEREVNAQILRDTMQKMKCRP